MELKIVLDLMDSFGLEELLRIYKDGRAIADSPLGKNEYPHDAVMIVGVDKKSDGKIDYQVVIHSQPPGKPGSYTIKSYAYQSTLAKPLHAHLNKA